MRYGKRYSTQGASVWWETNATSTRERWWGGRWSEQITSGHRRACEEVTGLEDIPDKQIRMTRHAA